MDKGKEKKVEGYDSCIFLMKYTYKERGSPYVDQVDLKVMILLPQSSHCWEGTGAPYT